MRPLASEFGSFAASYINEKLQAVREAKQAKKAAQEEAKKKAGERGEDSENREAESKPRNKEREERTKANQDKLNERRKQLFSEGEDEYTIMAGDNVWSISQKHGLTIEEIEQANAWLKDRKSVKADGSVHYHIRPGEKINIPQGHKPHATPSSGGKEGGGTQQQRQM